MGDSTKDSKSIKSRKPPVEPFPSILHRMLSRAEIEGFQMIVAWCKITPFVHQSLLKAKEKTMKDNTCDSTVRKNPITFSVFKVFDPERFEKQILPRFFQTTKFKSFLRQINLWQFKRIKSKDYCNGGYYHPNFVYDHPDLHQLMERKRVKGLYKRPPGAIRKRELTSHESSQSSAEKKDNEVPTLLSSAGKQDNQVTTVDREDHSKDENKVDVIQMEDNDFSMKGRNVVVGDKKVASTNAKSNQVTAQPKLREEKESSIEPITDYLQIQRKEDTMLNVTKGGIVFPASKNISHTLYRLRYVHAGIQMGEEFDSKTTLYHSLNLLDDLESMTTLAHEEE